MAAAIQILHVLSGAIARRPESAVRGVLIVCPESEFELQGAAAAGGALANGLFEQVLVDRDGHVHAGYNVPVVWRERDCRGCPAPWLYRRACA